MDCTKVVQKIVKIALKQCKIRGGVGGEAFSSSPPHPYASAAGILPGANAQVVQQHLITQRHRGVPVTPPRFTGLLCTCAHHAHQHADYE